jgi:error-prone DNA polymerase
MINPPPPYGYAELHCWSNFTFLEGGSHPEELVECALALGLSGVALTDRDGLYGSVRFAAHAKEHNLAKIVGSELTFEDGTRIVLLVEDARGYAHLCELISVAQLRGSKGDARLRLDDLQARAEGLIALSGGLCGRVERALARDGREAAAREAERLRSIFGERFYIELQHHLTPEDPQRNRLLVQLARELQIPYVATNGVAYARKDHAFVADVLFCIKNGTTVARAHAEYQLRPNAEYHLKSPTAMRRLFSPYPEAIEQTLVIAERCKFRLGPLIGQFPRFPVPQGSTPQTYLCELTRRGAIERYGTPLPDDVERRLQRELELIEKKDLAGYFLIVWDIVREAKERAVLCQGRGSAVGSIVCYTLSITAIDPMRYKLLFERFMSEERQEIPDIDIDFAHQDREQILQYVYQRYGRTNAAMVAEVITYHSRSALRDVGKALGLTLEEVGKLASDLSATEEFPKISATGLIGLLEQLCHRLENFPRHLGIHSGGMVITLDPLIQVAPIEWATMRDRTVIQWDKDDLQELGLIKIDLLGLGMLSLLREAFAIHKRVTVMLPAGASPQGSMTSPKDLALHTIPPDDLATYEMIQHADTIGVFQIESRAQQSILPRMKPACFYDLVMQVAIIRPGPIQGKMIHPFLKRRAGLEPVAFLHPKLVPVLERTMGVPLFQEQGIQIAIEAGGFSPGEADRLRRAMGHKRSRERLREVRPKLVNGMVKNGISREDAEKLFHMLLGFADYGFPESHAASFAHLAYVSAYIKCHYPAIFAAAILNVQPMGFYSTEVLVNDARRHNVTIEPIEVNASEYWSHVDARGALRLGFHLVRGLGEAQRKRLETALAGEPFADVIDFARRTQLEKEVLENLAAAGAFAPWFSTRRDAMWALRALDEREARGELGKLMDIDEPSVAFKPITPKEETAFDLWSTGVTPHLQAVAHFRDKLEAWNVIPAVALARTAPNDICRVGGLIITRQHPGTAKGFVFLTLEDETGYVNVIVRPDLYKRYRRTINLSSMLVIEGQLQRVDGCIDLLARRFWRFDDEGLTEGIHARNYR